MKQLKWFSMSVVFGLALLCVSQSAVAGTLVKGYGDTRAEAVYEAERKAKELAKEMKTCYNYVDESRCKKSSEGGWVCAASVANHEGSCGRGDIRP